MTARDHHLAASDPPVAASIRRTCSCDTFENVAIRRSPHPSSRADTIADATAEVVTSSSIPRNPANARNRTAGG